MPEWNGTWQATYLLGDETRADYLYWMGLFILSI